MVLTSEAGDAATTSWPSRRSLSTSFVPMRPLPPMTTIFMSGPPTDFVFDRAEDAGQPAGKLCSGLELPDRQSAVSGKSVSVCVDLGRPCFIKNKNKTYHI